MERGDVDVGAPEPEFDVALSFAGEQRDYVRAVASELTKHDIKVFYDEDNEIHLWGKDLGEELQRIYMTASNVVVMFVSSAYATKAWAIHERRSALNRAINERREYVLPVRFDATDLPGLNPGVSYLPLEGRPPAKLADNIMQKLVQLGGKVQPLKPAFRVHDSNGGDGKTCRIVVTDENGVPVSEASVLLLAQNGTSAAGRTTPEGIAEVSAEVRRKVAVFVAHPKHRGAYYRQHDNGSDLAVTLPSGANAHSVIFDGGTGHIPTFRPRLNPVGDMHDAEGIPRRTYLYVDNGSADGRAEQPFHFTIGRPMMLEDSNGYQIRATCVGFIGRKTLWEYEIPDSS